jgi:hypothetical protein
MSPVIFTPDNEPYLGSTLLLHFDQMIVSCLEQNAQTAKNSHNIKLTDSQKMACQVIPQAISIALSIRELIRQGYLFGAYVLVRSLVERAMILFYLQYFPEEIVHWNNGWKQGEAPGLSAMIDRIIKNAADAPKARASDMLKGMNSLLHAKPDSGYYNLVSLEDSRVGFAASKILNRPELCDELCADVLPTLTLIYGIMPAYFQEEKLKQP